MADYKDKIDEWQKTVRRKARELDEKYAISDLVDEGTKAAGDAAKRGAETLSSGADKVRAEAERLADEGNLGETARAQPDDAVRGARKAGEVIRDVAGDAGKKAGDVSGRCQKLLRPCFECLRHRRKADARFSSGDCRCGEGARLDQRKPGKAAAGFIFTGAGHSHGHSAAGFGRSTARRASRIG